MKILLCAVLALFLASVCFAQATAGDSTRGYFDVAGGRLYYEQCGSGPAVVLLHDGLLHSVVWDDVWPSLCANYHVLRYDRRGFGRSDPANARFSAEVDLANLMEHVGMNRATLVGSSSGSALALDFAISHPAKVEALFLIGPVVHGMRSSDFFMQRGNAANAPLAKGDVKGAAENWSKDRFQISGDRPAARKKVYETLVASPQNLKVAGQLEVRPSPPTVTMLSSVQAPTLVIVGEDDIADVHSFGGAIQAAVPVVRREVWSGDGHLIQLEKPAELVARLATFIAIAERKTVAVANSRLQAYRGTYLFFNSQAKVKLKNDQLLLQLNGDADIPLFAESATHFFVRTTGTEVQFEQDVTGNTNTMIIRSPGAEPIRCPRMEGAPRTS